MNADSNARVPWLRVDGVGPLVALTFDDCDRPGPWARILDGLAEADAKATFFALGMRVEQYPELAARTVAEAHVVGSHGWDHARMTALPADEVRSRLAADHVAWTSLAGVSPHPLFRPPYGEFDETLLTIASAAGYGHTVLWDVDPQDWREPGAAAVVDRVLGAARPGSIVGLHVVEDTAAALPLLIEGLRQRGLEPVTVAQLLALAGAGTVPAHRGGR